MGKRSPARLHKRRVGNCKRKVKHPSYEAAELALIEVATRGKLRSPDTAIYQCDLCGRYHWASHEPALPHSERKAP